MVFKDYIPQNNFTREEIGDEEDDFKYPIEDDLRGDEDYEQ